MEEEVGYTPRRRGVARTLLYLFVVLSGTLLILYRTQPVSAHTKPSNPPATVRHDATEPQPELHLVHAHRAERVLHADRLRPDESEHCVLRR